MINLTDDRYEWYPDYAYDFSNFAVSAGNVIQVDIVATSTTVIIVEGFGNKCTTEQTGAKAKCRTSSRTKASSASLRWVAAITATIASTVSTTVRAWRRTVTLLTVALRRISSTRIALLGIAAVLLRSRR